MPRPRPKPEPQPQPGPWSDWLASPGDPNGEYYRVRQTHHGGLEYEFPPRINDEAAGRKNEDELETGSSGGGERWPSHYDLPRNKDTVQEPLARNESPLPWIMSNSASDTNLVESRYSRPSAPRSASASITENPDIEDMRDKLRRAAASSTREFKDDSFCFPFFAFPDNPAYGFEPARGRVKIDTGAADNWISNRFLERASIPFTRDDSLRTYRGADGVKFKPLGYVSLTWYSTNQALSHRSVFLVGNKPPFDATLGSNWVLENDLDDFHEAVLPLRMVMSKDRSSDLKKLQAETIAAIKIATDIQRAQSRILREQSRKKQ
ncbi:hypothetical protein F5X68DRAFT_207029 [Plectosphaerella plurivora]|uniref:Uncharacterized protein n=1 Tax=Plectosphaerella plurivora TaxID=936078 RepID=A0A9P8VBU6_9PEZI|nr:hypothetical protein F5X68DRAFT_207029 [Plectosphaerella plurivora]